MHLVLPQELPQPLQVRRECPEHAGQNSQLVAPCPMRMHTLIVFLCTSIPAQRLYTKSIFDLLRRERKDAWKNR